MTGADLYYYSSIPSREKKKATSAPPEDTREIRRFRKIMEILALALALRPRTFLSSLLEKRVLCTGGVLLEPRVKRAQLQM